MPVPEKCPMCDSPFLVEKTTKKDGTYIACPNKECQYRRAKEEAAPAAAASPVVSQAEAAKE
jgi:DNA topoisomerase-1